MPNWFTRALSGMGLMAGESPDVAPDPWDARFWGGMSTASMSGQSVTAETALQLDVVQSVLCLLYTSPSPRD